MTLIKSFAHNYFSRIAVCILLLFLPNEIIAQTFISGKVFDKNSNTPVAHVSIIELETYESTETDSLGFFKIEIHDINRKYYLAFYHNEFETIEIEVNPKLQLDFKIALESNQTLHNEVVIKSKRQKYSNKNNPAVELIRKAIDLRHLNDPNTNSSFQSELYEKINIGVSRAPKLLTHNFLFKPFRFVFENYDTVSYPGHKNLTIYLEENWLTHSNSHVINKSKRYIHHQKKISLDPNYINEEGTIARLKHLYQDVNIYDNNLILVTNNFLSPIGVSATHFYKYFIIDTTTTDYNTRIVHLRVEPRNFQDLLLFGDLYIDIDRNHAITEYRLETTKSTNINFVDKVIVESKFHYDSNTSRYYMDEYKNDILFSLYYNSNRKMIGTRHLKSSSISINPSFPDTLFSEPVTQLNDKGINVKSDSTYYAENRLMPFTVFEQKTYDNIDSMKNMRYFKNLIDWGTAVTTGYKRLGRFDIGPIYRFYSYNDVEKHRLRFGIRTNPNQFDRFFASSYLAYATKDKSFRYNLLGIYSIKNKRIYSYPMSYIQAWAQRDMKLQGRIGEINVQDNIIESIQRGENNKFLLVQNFKLDYVQEFKRNFVLTTYAMYNDLRPQGALYFTINTSAHSSDTITSLKNTAIGVNMRWSPNEKIFNDRTQRNRLHGTSPIYTLGIEKGISGIFNSEQDYWKVSASFNKRNLLGPLGILDIKLAGQTIFGEVYYPLLIVPRANQTYTFSGHSYNLMNNGEFISDRQFELNLNYRMMGFIFNKLPLIKYLRLREVAGVKVLYGHLSNHNNPLKNPNVLTFPVDAQNLSYIHEFSPWVPYIEWNVGIENIFKFLRVDYVRRVNYLDHRKTNKHGINVSVVIDF